MTTIDQLTDAARRLTPEEIRGRLTDLDREARILRALLRARLRGQLRQPTVERTEGARS